MAQGEQAETARKHKEQGAALFAKGKLEAALAEYERAVLADPGDIVARRRVAELLANLGRISDAVKAYQLLAGRFAAEGRLMNAISMCKVVLQLDPHHQETQATLARLYARRSSSPGRARMPDSMSGAIDFSRASAAVLVSKPVPKSQSKPLLALPAAPEPPAQVDIELSKLPSAPLFSELPEEVMRALLERLAMISFEPGQAIVTEGETGRSLYVLASGSVEVVRTLPSGERRVLDRMPAGSFFGEIGLVADVQRLASVVAAEECVVLEVSREMIAEVARTLPYLTGLVRGFYQARLLANLLRSSPLFVPLGEAERRAVAEKFVLRSAEAGEALLLQGEPGRGLFLLLRGRCAVSFRDGADHVHALPELGEGAVMGEISVMTGSAVTTTVTALTRAVLLFLDPGTVAEHLLANPAVRAVISKLGAERQERTDRLEAAAFEPALL
jgi:CRP-like cAMP-binding protein